MKIDIKETKESGWIQITTIDERWYRREADGVLFPSVTWILQSYPKGKQFQNWRDKLGAEAADEVRDEAGRKGGRVHNAIAALIFNKMKGEPFLLRIDDVYPDNEGDLKEFNAEEWKTLMTFVNWWKESDPTPICFEQVCWNDEHAYAGTIDFVCEIGGERYVVDFKTSKSIYPSHELQVASYVHTPQAEGAAKGAILQIGYTLNQRGWKFTEIENIPGNMEVFLATKKLWWNENKKITPKQYEFPDTLTLEGLTETLERALKKTKN